MMEIATWIATVKTIATVKPIATVKMLQLVQAQLGTQKLLFMLIFCIFDSQTPYSLDRSDPLYFVFFFDKACCKSCYSKQTGPYSKTKSMQIQ